MTGLNVLNDAAFYRMPVDDGSGRPSMSIDDAHVTKVDKIVRSNRRFNCARNRERSERSASCDFGRKTWNARCFGEIRSFVARSRIVDIAKSV